MRLLWVFATLAALPVQARTLTVGVGQDYAQPSDAARVAATGDEVRILPGTYYDCAVWDADGLTIEGAGPETVLTDTACQGKASFVIRGRGVAVRDLTFARIRVPDGNGAGIRAEGPDLLVERVRFENDQEGLLAASLPGGTLRVLDCMFTGEGAGGGAAAGAHVSAALAVGGMDRLVVRDTVFEAGRAGAAIVSEAALTEIDGSRIAAPAAPDGASVQVSGGLSMQATRVQAGPVRGGGLAAVLALAGGPPDAPLTLRHNTLEGRGTLLLNWSGRPARIEANEVGADGAAESTAGAWPYRARRAAHAAYDALHGAASVVAHGVLNLVRGR